MRRRDSRADKLTQKRKITFLALLCSSAYLVGYIIRQNYSAVLVEIIAKEGYSKPAASAALTGLFITYGLGQIVSGYLCEYIRPAKIIGLGLLSSSCMNLLIPFCDNAAALTARFVTALAHPFDAVCAPYPREAVVDVITDSQLEEVFSAAKEHQIAVEINVSSYGDCPSDQLKNHFMTRVLLAARKCGCMFTFGSDAHTPRAQYALTKGPIIADILGITEADLHPIVR